jgi:hypothetical protein
MEHDPAPRSERGKRACQELIDAANSTFDAMNPYAIREMSRTLSSGSAMRCAIFR